MATLLVVENGWSSKRLYFADTEDGLTKAKQGVKEQKNLNKLNHPDYADEVFLSRLRAEKEEESVSWSSSDDDDEEEEEQPKSEKPTGEPHDAIDRRLVGKIQIVRPVLKVDDDEHKRTTQ